MSFKHINADDRSVIATLINEQRTNSYIARRLGVNRSTISRELKRNQLKSRLKSKSLLKPSILDIDCRHYRGNGLAQNKYEVTKNYTEQLTVIAQYNRFYVAKEATRKSKIRRTLANQQRICLVHNSNSWLETYVRYHLTKDQWSPDQMSGDLKYNYGIVIYPQTIYDYIYLSSDKKYLVKHLRHGGNPYRHKRGTNARIKARATNLPSIHERDQIIEYRTRIGDLEGDTIVGLDKKDRILTHVDRSSGECNLGLVLNYNASKIALLTMQTIQQKPGVIHTITYDRGNEFAEYQFLEVRANTKIYFADAYCSNQRGSNENLNGLVRQYFPKRSDFKNITPRQVKLVEIKLNNRPRKRYNYRTPIQQRQYLLAREKLVNVAIRDRI